MICIPLYHIHSKNIVDRNINPDNILSKYLGEKELFVIIGFGSAFKPDSGSVTTVRDTMTPFYASIEQMDMEDAHPSFDIWSLGITLFTLMAR